MNLQRYYKGKRRYLLLTIVLLLTGCFGESKELMFNGVYTNPNNSDQLKFSDGKVEIQSDGQTLVAPFTIDDDTVVIEVKRHSQEKRPEIVMRIYSDGERLTCSSCAMYDLSNIWNRITK
ncbi:hypothetical protein ACXJY6_15645 [Vibrio sp. RC27]